MLEDSPPLLLLSTSAWRLSLADDVCWLVLCCNLLDSGPELLFCDWSWTEGAGSTVTLEEGPVRAGGGWKGVGSCATIGFAFFFLIKFILFVCYVWVCTCQLVHLEVRGQPFKVGPLLPLWGFQEPKSGHKVWPLPPKPSLHLPCHHFKWWRPFPFSSCLIF